MAQQGIVVCQRVLLQVRIGGIEALDGLPHNGKLVRLCEQLGIEPPKGPCLRMVEALGRRIPDCLAHRGATGLGYVHKDHTLAPMPGAENVGLPSTLETPIGLRLGPHSKGRRGHPKHLPQADAGRSR